jgi:hypothetical protein
VARSAFCSASLLLDMILIPEQDSPSCPRETTIHNGNPRREPEHRLPSDVPEQLEHHERLRPIDAVQVKRQANELARLAGEIPSAVEQANKGVLSKDLNDRLKQIKMLSERLCRQLFRVRPW